MGHKSHMRSVQVASVGVTRSWLPQRLFATESSPGRVVVLGGGAIGSLVAAHLSPHLPHQLALVSSSRPRHVEMIESNGLMMHAVGESPVCADRINAYHDDASALNGWHAEKADLAIVAVKADWLQSTLERARQLTREGGTILCLHNGHQLEVLERFSVDASQHVIPAFTYHGAACNPIAPGSVHHHGAGQTTMTALSEESKAAVNDVAAMLEVAGWTVSVTSRAEWEQKMWSKLAVNCVIGALTALTRQTNGILDRQLGLVERLANELSTVAHAHGVPLSAEEIAANVARVAAAAANNTSSMLADVASGSAHSELEAINGWVSKAAKRQGLETPLNDALVELVQLSMHRGSDNKEDQNNHRETAGLQLCTTIDQIRQFRQPLRTSGLRVGFVPTMGSLHAGHLALVQQALTECDECIFSIFVNPTQFAPHEDLAQYRAKTEALLQQDLAALNQVGAAAVFAPVDSSEMFPDGRDGTRLDPRRRDLATLPSGEWATRPGFFNGVATVCTKLFNVVQPDAVYFGRKDAEQCRVIHDLIRDLNMDIEMVVCDTVREHDGLALSSRNARLSPTQRAAAPVVYQSLKAAQQLVRQNPGISVGEVRQCVETSLFKEALLTDIEYVVVEEAESGAPVEQGELPTGGLIISCAVQLGEGPRLIDSIVV